MLWRHWWCHRSQNGVVLHNLSSVSIFEVELTSSYKKHVFWKLPQWFWFSTCDNLSKRNKNRNFSFAGRCPVSHRLWHRLFQHSTIKIEKCQTLPYLFTQLCHWWRHECVTRNLHSYTPTHTHTHINLQGTDGMAPIPHSLIFQEKSKKSDRTHEHQQAHPVKLLSPRYRGR